MLMMVAGMHGGGVTGCGGVGGPGGYMMTSGVGQGSMGVGVMGGGVMAGGMGEQEIAEMLKRHQGEMAKKLPELLRQKVASLAEDNWMFEVESEGRQ